MGALAIAAVGATGCFRHRTTADGRPAAPSLAELGKEYGCTGARQASAASVAPGAPLCSVLGTYGEPKSVSTQQASGMRLLSVLQHPRGRYVSVVYVYYEDTKANRQNGRPIGRWLVQSVRESR